jgi:hypothetical protein
MEETTKTIKLCGQEVELLYCPAAECNYEDLAGKSSKVFIPTIKKDEDGNVIEVIDNATLRDYLLLGLGAIAAAADYRETTAAITVKDVFFRMKPEETTELIMTVGELRNKWYHIPEVIPESEFTEDSKTKRKKPKNSQPPTTSTKQS